MTSTLKCVRLQGCSGLKGVVRNSAAPGQLSLKHHAYQTLDQHTYDDAHVRFSDALMPYHNKTTLRDLNVPSNNMFPCTLRATHRQWSWLHTIPFVPAVCAMSCERCRAYSGLIQHLSIVSHMTAAACCPKADHSVQMQRACSKRPPIYPLVSTPRTATSDIPSHLCPDHMTAKACMITRRPGTFPHVICGHDSSALQPTRLFVCGAQSTKHKASCKAAAGFTHERGSAAQRRAAMHS